MQHTWIFQLETPLNNEQTGQIQTGLNQLMESWKSHGAPVPGQAEIRHQQFVLVQAEPGANSGCSIDSMTHGVEGILGTAGVAILPNNFITFRNAVGEVDKVDFREVKSAIADGVLSPETTIFDASLQEGSLDGFEKKLSESWLARFLPRTQA